MNRTRPVNPARSTLLLACLACNFDPAGPPTPAAETSTGDEPTGEPVVPTGVPDESTGGSPPTTDTGDATGDDGSGTAATTAGPACGDGVVDDGEGCDDGAANKPYAPCTDECQPNVCGDGKVHTGVETCDHGAENLDTGACRSDCQLNVCGDGFWLVGTEECDGPNNGQEYGGCDTACTINRCGDGTLDAGFEICDAGEANGSGRPGEDGMSGCSDTCGFDGRWLFISSMTFTGDLGTRAGADLACQNMAEAAMHEHPERFVALLADALGSPATYVLPDPGGRPFILPTGLILADNYEDLIAGGPGLGVTTTETGEVLEKELVWTNLNPFGGAYLSDDANTCTSWSSMAADQLARVGLSSLPADHPGFATWQAERQWLSFDSLHCEKEYRIYCIEAGTEE